MTAWLQDATRSHSNLGLGKRQMLLGQTVAALHSEALCENGATWKALSLIRAWILGAASSEVGR
jgi:hypothetical protein